MRHEALVGRKVAGRFTITRFLGEGGMASVYVAERDAEPRRVALKIMNPEFTQDRAFVRRFQREAKAASRVKHPNSVKIFEYGVEGSLSYIVMELLVGDDLYALLEQHGAISQARAARILADVCDALVVAHEMGIVHRDLKPENIMMIADPTHPYGERVKVLDFGIAKILDTVGSGEDDGDPRADPMSVVTRAGTFIGTPAYMSPEQCGLMPVDTRADIYTCGVLLFQLVTGRLPFEGETPLHTATLHIHSPAPLPSSFAPGIDPRLEALIMKALAKKPSERHQTARHLGASLRKLLPELPDDSVGIGPISRRQASSMLPREGLPGIPPLEPLPPLPPLPHHIHVADFVPDAPREVSIESARTLVSVPDAGPPPEVLVHTLRPVDVDVAPTPARVSGTDLPHWRRESVPEISLQLPWSEGADDAALTTSGEAPDSDEDAGEDESTLTMVRPDDLVRGPPKVRVNMHADGAAIDAGPAGREVKATLRSAADFGLSPPDRKSESSLVSVESAPPVQATRQSVDRADYEPTPRRTVNNTVRLSAPSPSVQSAPQVSLGPELPSIDPTASGSMNVTLSSGPAPSAVVLPIGGAGASRRSALGLESTLVADQRTLGEAAPQPPGVLPEVHLVRAPEQGWLGGRRGLIVGFVAGMVLTVLAMVLYLRLR